MSHSIYSTAKVAHVCDHPRPDTRQPCHSGRPHWPMASSTRPSTAPAPRRHAGRRHGLQQRRQPHPDGRAGRRRDRRRRRARRLHDARALQRQRHASTRRSAATASRPCSSPARRPAARGNSGAIAMTLDAAGNIVVAGYGGSQSMVVARFTAGGAYEAQRRLLRAAPDRLLGARARPARTQHRHARRLCARPPSGVRGPGTPTVIYGQRADRDAPGHRQQHDRVRRLQVRRALARLGRRDHRRPRPTTAPSRTPRAAGAATRASRPSSPTTATSSPRRIGPDGAAWVQRFTGAGVGATDHAGSGGHSGRVTRSREPARDQAAAPTRTPPASRSAGAANRRCSWRASPQRAGLRRLRHGGVALARVGGGNNTGQALVSPGRERDRRRLGEPGGPGRLRPRAPERGQRPVDRRVRPGRTGHHADRHARHQRLHHRHGALAATSGRLRPRDDRTGGLATVAGRYFETGAPPPPPPLARRLDDGRRPDHDELRPRERHGQRQRHREHLVGRVRHDHRATARDPCCSHSTPRTTTTTCRPCSPASLPAPSTTHAS